MSLREEIEHLLHETYYIGNTLPYPNQVTNRIIFTITKTIDEEINQLTKKIKDKELFLDGNCIDSNIRILEKIKVLLK